MGLIVSLPFPDYTWSLLAPYLLRVEGLLSGECTEQVRLRYEPGTNRIS